MSKKKYELLERKYGFENGIFYEKPILPQKLNSNTLTSITNALDAEAYLDDRGQLWLAKDKLHSILRTSKTNVNNIFDGFDDIIKVDEHFFVRGYEVMGLITKQIEESDTLKRGKYLKFSGECIAAIRDSDKAVRKRAEFNEEWREEKKKLKSTRIRLYNIKNDELTGELINKRTAEFSHIRSSSQYKNLSLEIENGLIVNKETHDIITKNGICNENELLFLCEENNWDVSWYQDYTEFLKR